MRVLTRKKTHAIGDSDRLLYSMLNKDGTAVSVYGLESGGMVIGWRHWNGRERVYDRTLRFCLFFSHVYEEEEYAEIVRRTAARLPKMKPRSAWDYQRQRVYNWEKQRFHYDEGKMTLEECKALVAKVWRAKRHWGSPPKVSDGRGRRAACSMGGEIKLPRWARLNWVVLHELAHELTPDKHGPKFMKAYVDLLVEFGGFSRNALMTELAAFKIDVAA